MRIAYIDPFSGASGDMLLGALIDAGLGLDDLHAALAPLELPHLSITAAKITRHGITGTQATVEPEPDHHSRLWSEIRRMISSSALSDEVKAESIAIFTSLAEAEASVHNTTVDDVHFHEVGALDTIVDIVGTVAGLKLLGVEQVYSGPVHLGGGTVWSAHGVLPVPAPATAKLLAMTSTPIAAPFPGELEAGELLTPTGAAIIGTLASFDRPAFVPSAVGIGFGSKELPWANYCRITIGETETRSAGGNLEGLIVIETNIDDMNPQFYEVLSERLFATGALDVWTAPISMKKNRPGMMLSVLTRPANQDEVVSLIVEQSTTLGVRIRNVDRISADRSFESVETRWGAIRVKLKIWKGRVIDIAPEYDDCAALARASDISVRTVWNEAYQIGQVYIGRRSDPVGNLTRIDPIAPAGAPARD